MAVRGPSHEREYNRTVKFARICGLEVNERVVGVLAELRAIPADRNSVQHPP